MSEKFGGMPPDPKEKAEKPKELVWRVSKEQFDSLPDGTELTSISGEKIIKSKDFKDFDTRGGLMGYGFLEKDKPTGMSFSEKATLPIIEVSKEAQAIIEGFKNAFVEKPKKDQ